MSPISTLLHVQEACRNGWADILAPILYSLACDPTNLDQWSLFFCLPKAVLATPSRGGRDHYRALNSQDSGCIKRWRDGEHTSLWQEVTNPSPTVQTTGSPFFQAPLSSEVEDLRKTNAGMSPMVKSARWPGRYSQHTLAGS